MPNKVERKGKGKGKGKGKKKPTATTKGTATVTATASPTKGSIQRGDSIRSNSSNDVIRKRQSFLLQRTASFFQVSEELKTLGFSEFELSNYTKSQKKDVEVFYPCQEHAIETMTLKIPEQVYCNIKEETLTILEVSEI